MLDISTLIVTLKWRFFFFSKGVRLKDQKEHILYVKRLSKAKVPVIFDKKHLSNILNIEIHFFDLVIENPLSFYRHFFIPKRRKEESREVNAPSSRLLMVQRWVNEDILNNVSLHSAAHGFVRGRSIFSNATQHTGTKTLLKMDITNFFPSIKQDSVMTMFHYCPMKFSIFQCITDLY